MDENTQAFHKSKEYPTEFLEYCFKKSKVKITDNNFFNICKQKQTWQKNTLFIFLMIMAVSRICLYRQMELTNILIFNYRASSLYIIFVLIGNIYK